MTVLAVTGLVREARIVSGHNVLVVVSGGDAQSLPSRIRHMLVPDMDGIISIGLGGGLDPALSTGDVVIADSIIAPDGKRTETNPGWTKSLLERLPQARQGAIIGSDAMVLDSFHKARLHLESRALAVDMESHVAATIAVEEGLPFAALRVICDPASRSLPQAVTQGMKPDGQMNIGGVVKAVAADPFQIPSLIRTGMEANTALSALLRCRNLLGIGLGLPDFGELVFDVT